VYDRYIMNDSRNLCEYVLSSDARKGCHEKCPAACVRLMHDTFYDKTLRDEPKNKSIESYFDLKIEHSSVATGTMTEWKEVDTRTKADFISNVGGTLGLFLGCTIFTLAQLLLCLLAHMFDVMQPSNRKMAGHEDAG
jgi:hypothetical protein